MVPFAGGNRYSYRQISEKLDADFDVVTLDFPGHGSRTNESLLTDSRLLTMDLYALIQDRLHQPYCLFGHSMGGLLVWLLAILIRERKQPMPMHIVIGGAVAPSAPSRALRKTHLLDPQSFREKLNELGGTMAQVLDNNDLYDYYEPILRADFKAYENYSYESAKPLDIPVTIVNGTNEDIDEQEVRMWQNEFERTPEFVRLAGSHFFLFENPISFVNILRFKLHPVAA
jgi:surfactin synthase thioesterase subunit